MTTSRGGGVISGWVGVAIMWSSQIKGKLPAVFLDRAS